MQEYNNVSGLGSDIGKTLNISESLVNKFDSMQKNGIDPKLIAKEYNKLPNELKIAMAAIKKKNSEIDSRKSDITQFAKSILQQTGELKV